MLGAQGSIGWRESTCHKNKTSWLCFPGSLGIQLRRAAQSLDGGGFGGGKGDESRGDQKRQENTEKKKEKMK